MALIQGHALTVLAQLEPESVRCCVTSPPFWGLRDYQTGGVEWPDGWHGELGLEATPEEYVAHIVDVFRAVRRVLCQDGTVWLNLGDSYASSWPAPNTRRNVIGSPMADGKRGSQRPPRMGPGLKEKDLIGIPWRVAFALQADGWWLRRDIIWHKPNPMPESCTDRPTTAHEYIFLLTRSAQYYYDAKAISEPCVSGPSDVRKMRRCEERIGGRHKTATDPRLKASAHTHIGRRRAVGNPSGRNKRSVWTISTKPFRHAHFATFPEDIPEICIRAGSEPGDLVLDPFIGSGTTGLVADRLGRRWIGIDANPEYIALAAKRTAQAPLWDLEADAGSGGDRL